MNEAVAGPVFVVDEGIFWRSVMSSLLGDQRYVPIEFGNLEAARLRLADTPRRDDLPAGICLDLAFGPGDSVGAVERKFPRIWHFINLIRWQYRHIPLVIVGDDEEAGLRTSNELNKLGITAAFVGKETGRFLEEFPTTAEAVFSSPGKVSGADDLSCVVRLCRRFHSVARRLESHRRKGRETIRIEDEYDVQDLLHGLLATEFDDIRVEEWTPSYAGGASRADFLLKDEQIVVEVKKTRKGAGAREIGEQLLIDIGKYRGHPDCKRLLCFVYDPEGRILNARGFEKDLTERGEGLEVVVVVSPAAN